MSANERSPLSDLSLDAVLSIFRDHGVREILFKILPSNANSKNQVYLASDLAQLGKIPSGEVLPYESKSGKLGSKGPIFRSMISLYWVTSEGNLAFAPEAKLISYPQYPEVRFSGFLQGCAAAPSFLFDKNKRGAEAGRILFLGIRDDEQVIALALPPEAPAVVTVMNSAPFDQYGALSILPMENRSTSNGFLLLLNELCRIHRLDWVNSMRLDRNGQIVDCAGTNCGGNTLEASLGIKSNGISEPDFHGWEVKARTVTNILRPGISRVTLFTPEPSGGIYVSSGAQEFVRQFGYRDTRGREDRLNFGGIYRCNAPPNGRTKLRLILDGYEPESGLFKADGAIRLIDHNESDALSWSFAKIMDHWKKKHAHAAYIPCEQLTEPSRRYRYASQIQIGEGAQFKLFLKGVAEGKIFYDPGIKLENASTAKPLLKRRSQIRVASNDLGALYVTSRIVSVCGN